MSRRNLAQHGFTIVELTISMVLVALIGTMFYTFFHSNLINYVNLQRDGTSASSLTIQASRVSNVIRGLTGIISGTDNDLNIYAYFFPSDTYVSQVHYYLSSGQLLADVTPMTSNPPIGTPITGGKKTYTIIDNFYQPAGTKLFTYYDASNTAIGTPLSDLNTPKAIQVNLAVPLSTGGSQTIQVQVSLRNRKTNL